ncbi:MAG: ribonuclease Y [Phycisphaerales bacterium JB060]
MPELVSILIGLGGLVIGVLVGLFAHARLITRTLSQARAEADSITERARTEAGAIESKAEADAEKKVHQRMREVEDELDTERKRLRQEDRDLSKREASLDKAESRLADREKQADKRDRELHERDEKLEARSGELETLIERQTRALADVAGMTPEEAREAYIERVAEESRHEAAAVARKITDEAEAQAKERSTEILLQAAQRYAGEFATEHLVRSVAIPNDQMKGRIIGREGRNIRAIEKMTGVDIIVDDTPGVITVSCFDKVRQSIAVEALERLISDGRMHPTRIEETVEKVRAEFDERIRKHGKDAQMEVKIGGLHAKVIEAMGKLHYRTSYGQNVLAHSIEVATFSQIIADQLGLNGKLARRCGFLHDIGNAMDHEMEGGHPKIGMDFAKRYGEKEPVLNAIGGHHGDIPSTSFYTPIVMAADALSGARPGARRESMELYIQRLNDLQDIAKAHKGVVEAYAVQAGREVRVMVDAKKVSDDEAHYVATQIAKRVADEMTFPGEIRVTVLRETRAVEIAR